MPDRRFDHKGRAYDAAVPVYVVINEDLVFDRLLGRVLRRSSLPDDLTTPEIDTAPQAWLDANGFAGSEESQAGAAITAVASAIVTDTGTITIGGGPADQAYTVTVTIDTDDGNLDQVFPIAVSADDTAVDVAAALAGETLLGGTLTLSGREVTVVASGGTLTKLQVAVA